MKRSYIKRVSKKQQIKLNKWRAITLERATYLAEKYGYALCEYCGGAEGGHELTSFDGHHIDKNRRNNTQENCYICHRICHGKITDENLLVTHEDFQGGNNPLGFHKEV